MSQTPHRPQDRVVLREGAARPGEQVIEPHSVLLWTIVSIPLLGYFVWYYRAHRDCSRLLNDSFDPWFWMAMLFPGMLLLLPYAIAQAKIAARVEIASRMALPTAGYLALCVAGFLIPALMPLVLQPRLNRAARIDPLALRRMPIG
jgi:hypothetical protein